MKFISNKKWKEMQTKIYNMSAKINGLEWEKNCILNYIHNIGMPPSLLGIKLLYSKDNHYLYCPTIKDEEIMNSLPDIKNNPLHRTIFNIYKRSGIK